MSFTDSGESSKKLETTEHSSRKGCKRKPAVPKILELQALSSLLFQQTSKPDKGESTRKECCARGPTSASQPPTRARGPAPEEELPPLREAGNIWNVVGGPSTTQ